MIKIIENKNNDFVQIRVKDNNDDPIYIDDGSGMYEDAIKYAINNLKNNIDTKTQQICVTISVENKTPVDDQGNKI